MKLKALAVAVAAAALLAALAPSASAATTTATNASILKSVLSSSNPQAVYNALSPADQAMVKSSVTKMSPMGAQVTLVQGKPISAAVFGATPGTVSTLSSGCWTEYWYYGWGNWGILMAHTWMTLNWCGNGSRITNWNLGTRGGSSQFPGLSYEGIVATGAWNVGWEYRQYVEFKFSAYVLGDSTPCQQIRGGASGLYSTRDTCNLG